MCGHTRGPIIYIPSFIEIRSRVSEPRGVKIWHFPLLWLVAFTTACTTVQAVTSRDYNWILRRHVTTYKQCAKYILISLLNKLVDLKYLNFIGKSFRMHAVLLHKVHFPKLVFTRKICTGWRKKTSRSLRNYNCACTLSGKNSFCALVHQEVLLLFLYISMTSFMTSLKTA